MIEGATVDWKLWKAWKKDSLRSHWNSLDLLVSTETTLSLLLIPSSLSFYSFFTMNNSNSHFSPLFFSFLLYKYSAIVHSLSPSLTQLGTIPYAEVFGETSGYATVKETLGYMESYAWQEALRHLSGGSTEGLEAIQLPFYVFDSEVLTESFPGYYTLPRRESMSNLCSIPLSSFPTFAILRERRNNKPY